MNFVSNVIHFFCPLYPYIIAKCSISPDFTKVLGKFPPKNWTVSYGTSTALLYHSSTFTASRWVRVTHLHNRTSFFSPAQHANMNESGSTTWDNDRYLTGKKKTSNCTITTKGSSPFWGEVEFEKLIISQKPLHRQQHGNGMAVHPPTRPANSSSENLPSNFS